MTDWEHVNVCVFTVTVAFVTRFPHCLILQFVCAGEE